MKGMKKKRSVKKRHKETNGRRDEARMDRTDGKKRSKEGRESGGMKAREGGLEGCRRKRERWTKEERREGDSEKEVI